MWFVLFWSKFLRYLYVNVQSKFYIGTIISTALIITGCVCMPSKTQLNILASDIKFLYEKYPSLRTNSNIDVIKDVASKTLGTQKTHDLINLISNNSNTFHKIRSSVITTLVNSKVVGHAVVSGQSVTGMVAAAILAKSGYRVDVYETRTKYSRNIQWAGRQSLVEELASIDQELANNFIKSVANTIDRGSIHLKRDGTKRHSKHDGLIKSCTIMSILPDSIEMMKKPSVVTMQAKLFEEMLMHYLNTLPNVYRHIHAMKITKCTSDKEYYCIGQYKPDIIIVAEGAASKTRDALGIKSVVTSPSRLQIAGNIEIDGGGVMIKHWRNEKNILLSGLIGTKNSGVTWMVADIDIAKITQDIAYGTSDESNIYASINQDLIDNEFRRLVAEAMELPLTTVQQAKINGPIEGKAISTFFLQQRISKKAFSGKNVILLGDSVGNNHWSVGGGMQIGAISHAEQLKILLLDLDMKVPVEIALQKYSDNVIRDSQVWGEVGIVDFYHNLDQSCVKEVYNTSIEQWRNGNIATPLDAMHKTINTCYQRSHN